VFAGIIRRLHIVGHRLIDRLAGCFAGRGLDGLNPKAHRDRLPRVQAEMLDLDLACAPRLRFFLKRLINHRAVSVGIGHKENRDWLIVLGQFVDQIADGAGGVALRR